VAQYIVREAVLVPDAGGSAWRVTFAPQRGPKDQEIVVMIRPATLDEMFFADTYTLEQIETLRDDRAQA
jgi:hypothetical protein